MRSWARFPIRLCLFILSPLPWLSGFLQSLQYAVWAMLLVGISQAHRFEPLRVAIHSVPGGTPTIVAGGLGALTLIAAGRLFYRLDRRAELRQTGKAIHAFIQEGVEIQNKVFQITSTASQAPMEYMALYAEVSVWMVRARSLVFEHFSDAEASRFEYALGFDGAEKSVTKDKLVDALKRRLEYLYELQGRIANRIWALRP